MSARRRMALAGLVLLLLPVGTVSAGGLRELEDGWLASPLRVRHFLDPEAGRCGGWCSAGRARLYGMPELPLSRLAGGWRGTRSEIEASWQRLGETLYREDRWRVAAGVGARHRLGLSGGVDRLQAAGYRPLAETALEVFLRAYFGAGVTSEFRIRLTSPPTWHAGRSQHRLVTVGGSRRGLLWTIAVERSVADGPSIQGEVLMRPATGCAFGLRLEAATGTVVLVSCWTRRDCLLRTSHSVHPRLGLTHRWSLGWRFGGGGR